MNAIRKTATVSGMTLTALMAVAGAAGAQTVIRPMPVPNIAPVPMVVQTPVVVPTPRVNPVPDPIVIDLSALEALKLTMPDIVLPDVTAIAAQASAAAQTSRESVERARMAMDQTFNYNYSLSRDGDYAACKDFQIRRQYEQAIVRCDRVIAKKASNVDGALYWKAYAQFKLGKTEDSLATIAQLRKDHGQSRYLGDAKLLEADARKRGGQAANPADTDDEELKLLAIAGIQNADPDRAIPLLEGVLTSNNSLAVKRKALVTLAMNPQPRAYQILLSYAKGAGNPDLQMEAIRYLTSNRKQVNAADLMAIYQSTQDTEVKLAIISALRSTENRTALSQIVSTQGTPIVIRSSALNGLTGILSPQDLWTLYEKETNKELRLQLVSSFGSVQATDQLARVIKTEKDPDVRRRALGALGSMKAEKSGQMLVDLYGSEQDADAKRSIIGSLARQNNAEGLVAVARKESTLSLKTEIVRKLSDMAPHSKVAADYLMEIIK